MSRVLVLGAGGFLGGHAVRALTEAGGVVVPGPPRARLDLARVEHGELVALLRRVRPVALVNAAGLVAGSAQELEQGNPEQVRRLLAACAVALPGVRLVHLGSLAEYGTAAPAPGGGWTEEGPAQPGSEYGAAKLRATAAVLAASERGEVDGVVLRVANPVGAGQPATSLVGSIIGQLRHDPGAPVRLGPLDGRRDVVSARDVGRAVAAAALLPPGPRHRLINIGTGRSVPVRDVVGCVLRLAAGVAALAEPLAAGSARSAAVLDAVPDVRRAAAVLGWVAEDDLEAAVRDALGGAGLLRRAS